MKEGWREGGKDDGGGAAAAAESPPLAPTARPPTRPLAQPNPPRRGWRRWRRWYLSVHHKSENDEKADSATRGELLLEEEAEEGRGEDLLLKIDRLN